MKKYLLNKRLGFSLMEMMIAMTVVMVLSATSYKILSTQGRGQKQSVFDQKQNAQATVALDRFRKDAALIDSNWQQSGVATIYPHQGLGLGQNFYVNTLSQAEGLNDGVTFLKRDPKRSTLYTLNDSAEYPAATGTNVLLFGNDLTLQESTVDLVANDWVLLFADKKYVIGVVTSVTQGGTNARIKLRQLNASSEVADMHINTNVGRASGYVTRAGVIPASYDWTGSNTVSTTTDDSIQFPKTTSYLQVVIPVSYELDWATNDGKPSGNSNQHLLNEDGTPKKMVVRTEYLPNGPTREYVSEAIQLGMTYDALVAKPTPTTFSLTGDLKGDIATNIGRGGNSDVQFVNVASANPDDSGMGDVFISTANITSMKMLLGNDRQQSGEKDRKFNEVQVSLALSRSKIKSYAAGGSPDAKNSKNLSADYANKAGVCFGCSVMDNRTLGKPVYVVQSATGVPAVPLKDPICYTNNPPATCQTNDAPSDNVLGSGQADVAIPTGLFVSNFVENGGLIPGNGELLILDETGEPFTKNPANIHCQDSATSTCCKGHGCEKIKFKPASANTYFAPSNVITAKMADGTSKMYVGGFGYESTTAGPAATTTVKRKPMFAAITTSPNMSLREYVAKYNVDATASGGCSIPSGLCKLVTLDPSNIVGSPDRLKDTTSMSVNPANGDLYLASYTRETGTDQTLSIYKYDAATGKAEEKVVDTSGIATNRLITSISQNTMTINGNTYLPIATTTSMNNGLPIIPSPDDAKIILYNIDHPELGPVELASHNGMIKGMAAVDGNLVLSGKLVSQIIPSAAISDVMSGGSAPKKLYTNEIVSGSGASAVYATGFYPDKNSYTNPDASALKYQQSFVYTRGISVTQMDNGDYTAIMTNEATVNDGVGPSKKAEFVTWKLNVGNLGGNRIIASIDTNFDHLEQSEVVAKIQKVGSEPSVALPGSFYVSPFLQSIMASIAPNTKVTLGLAPAMTEKLWADLYTNLMGGVPKYANLIFFGAIDFATVPDPVSANFSCAAGTKPSTCP